MPNVESQIMMKRIESGMLNIILAMNQLIIIIKMYFSCFAIDLYQYHQHQMKVQFCQ